MYKLSIGPCRNNGLGDYYQNQDGSWEIIADPKLGSRKKIIAALIHELIECVLAEQAGICEPDIDSFDRKFEERIAQGLEPKDAEPGDAKDAPYGRQHKFAFAIEQLIDIEMECRGGTRHG